MPIIETKGVVSSQGYGQFARSGPPAAYIEDVFSTWLYTGNGSTQTITNGIDLATKGGLVWIKRRSAADSNWLFDTNRGMTFSSASYVSSNSTSQQFSDVNVMRADATGFSWGSNSSTSDFNGSGTYASWTFAKQPKFFDVVTYTGNGASSQIVSHSLGVAPACIIIKKTSAAQNWRVYTRRNDTVWTSLYLNLTNAGADFNYSSISPALTSTTIDFGYINSYIEGGNNDNGATYVAYLFAHNAGGFGASGTDNVISCGSYVGTNAAQNINLGYEPQWLLIKAASGPFAAQPWMLMDTMRGLPGVDGQNARRLYPNTSSVENDISTCRLTSTGFQVSSNQDEINNSNNTYIYIAIRRGPMRTPTSGTSVFVPVNYTGTASSQTITTGITSDWVLSKSKNNIEQSTGTTRLSGFSRFLSTTNTNAEVYIDPTYFVTAMNNTAYNLGPGDGNSNTYTYTSWNFRRAPGFFDVVCYTGVASGPLTINHNLGVTPELVITKARTGTSSPGWFVGSNYLTNGYSTTGHILQLQSTAASVEQGYFRSANATTATLDNVLARSGQTYVAYLFASCPGVSKVGTYTGTGSTVQVNCGFTAGARLVLIKRTDAAGDWYVWDSARGIVAANDPYLLLNSTAAEVTNTDWVDTLATGFEVSNAGSNLVNVNGGTYLFLAVS